MNNNLLTVSISQLNDSYNRNIPSLFRTSHLPFPMVLLHRSYLEILQKPMLRLKQKTEKGSELVSEQKLLRGDAQIQPRRRNEIQAIDPGSQAGIGGA